MVVFDRALELCINAQNERRKPQVVLKPLINKTLIFDSNNSVKYSFLKQISGLYTKSPTLRIII